MTDKHTHACTCRFSSKIDCFELGVKKKIRVYLVLIFMHKFIYHLNFCKWGKTSMPILSGLIQLLLATTIITGIKYVNDKWQTQKRKLQKLLKRIVNESEKEGLDNKAWLLAKATARHANYELEMLTLKCNTEI